MSAADTRRQIKRILRIAKERNFDSVGYFQEKFRQPIAGRTTMVTRASGSQSTKTVPKQGQNKPVSGGAAGAGKDRGTAKLPTISKTTTRK
jgi:hypothetical protein